VTFMIDLRTVLTGAAMVAAVAAAGPSAAQEPETITYGWLKDLVASRADVLADRIEEQGEQRAAQEGLRGYFAEHVVEQAEQRADNVRRTGDYLVSCIDPDTPPCNSSGTGRMIVPDDYEAFVFQEPDEQTIVTAD
jgi:hypothetical protein